MASWLTLTIGRVLRVKRLKAKMSLAHVSKRTGLAISELGRVERGACDLDVLSLEQLAGLYSHTLRELLDQAWCLDDERILFWGPDAAAQLLRRPFRHVITFSEGTHAYALMQAWRTDCVVAYHAERDGIALLQTAINNTTNGKPIELCIVDETGRFCYDKQSGDRFRTSCCITLKMAPVVDALLCTTTRGRISDMRRLRDEIAKRRQTFIEQTIRLEEQGLEMTRQIERLMEMRRAIASKQAGALNDDDRLSALLKNLEARAQRLKIAADKVRVSEKCLSDQDRFMQNREQSLLRLVEGSS